MQNMPNKTRVAGSIAAMTLLAVCGQRAMAQAETCETATPIGEGVFFGDNSAATTDGAAGCVPTSVDDQWFAFTAAEDGWLEVDTCGSSFDSVLSVHSACPGSVGNTLACNDDRCGAASALGLPVEEGQTYLIRVASFSDSHKGEYQLRVDFKRVLFVEDDAAGANNGSSWQDAYTDLQDALDDARTNGDIDEVWVASGTYYPGDIGAPRTSAFRLINGVGIHGGFAGSEARLDARDLESDANISTLSGDLGRDDGANFANNAENSLHVVLAEAGTDFTAIITGFTITAGNANGTGFDNRGGGAFFDGSSPIITDCVFHRNTSSSFGGGLATRASTARIRDCEFIGNTTVTLGGGAVATGGAPVFIGCKFQNNTSAFGGGGVACSSSNAHFYNCLFMNNSATARGGAIYALGAGTGPFVFNTIGQGNLAQLGGFCHVFTGANITIDNSTVIRNRATGAGGGIYGDGSGGIVVQNAILWNNTDVGPADLDAQITRINGAPLTINNSCLLGYVIGLGGVGNIDQNPLFRSELGLDGLPATGDENLQLVQASPCIDAGDAAWIPIDIFDIDGDGDTAERVDIDFDGLARVEGDGPDMGALEASGCPADWNNDGVVNPVDVGAFLTSYFNDIANGTLFTDFDHNGVVNPVDVGAFLTEYFSSLGGC